MVAAVEVAIPVAGGCDEVEAALVVYCMLRSCSDVCVCLCTEMLRNAI